MWRFANRGRPCALAAISAVVLVALALRPVDHTRPESESRLDEGEVRERAQAILEEAGELQRLETAVALSRARDLYREALGLWRRISDRDQQAETLYQLGRAHRVLGDVREGRDAFQQALELQRTAGDLDAQARSLHGLGVTSEQLGEGERALGHYQEGLELAHEAGDPHLESLFLLALGSARAARRDLDRALELYEAAQERLEGVDDPRSHASLQDGLACALYQKHGDLKQALDLFDRALENCRRAGDRLLELRVLNNLGNVYQMAARPEEALDTFRRLLALARELGSRSDKAQGHLDLGTLLGQLGEWQPALGHLVRALELFRELEDPWHELFVLNSLGRIAEILGDYPEAIAHYEDVRRILEGFGDAPPLPAALNNLGTALWKASETRRAIEVLEESLAIFRRREDRPGEAMALNNLAWAHATTECWDEALELFFQALEIRREVGDPAREAKTWRGLGRALVALDRPGEGLEYLERALDVFRDPPQPALEADTLLAMAEAERRRGGLDSALTHLESATALLEDLRTRVTYQQYRRSFLASRREIFEAHVGVRMDLERRHPGQGHAEAALAVSEQARARGFLDRLIESGTDLRRGVDPELLEEERRLRRKLNARAFALSRGIAEIDGTPTAAHVEDAVRKLRSVESRIRERSPHHAALTQPRLAANREIRSLLDRDTVLLEYFLGAERSFLWTVTDASVDGFELPPRAEIEEAARRLHRLLSTPGPQQSQAEVEAARLSQVLLAPAADHLNAERLVVVTDGALAYLPFSVLPEPGGRAPLAAEHVVLYLPSATALATQRLELDGRPEPPGTLAVLADPVFSTDDPRLTAGDIPAASIADPDLTRALRDLRLDGFSRLPSTRREAEAIAVRVPTGELLVALDFAASRELATGGELARYRLLHFATHGLLDDRRPELSGLVLSLVDEKGHPRDGFLRAHEIFDLELTADLVVLSACGTGLGQEITGEGLEGLSRAFLYAGARQVATSLWNVPDAATATLMEHFYQALLDEGRPAPEALRRAQMTLRAEPRTRAPYYWAGFVLQGDWR